MALPKPCPYAEKPRMALHLQTVPIPSIFVQQELFANDSWVGQAHFVNLATPPSKKVAFERRYGDGGVSRFWGPQITPGAYDKDMWLKVAGTWAPMPLGYRAVQDFEYEETKEGKEHQLDGVEERMPIFGQDDEEAAAALLNLNPKSSHRG
ncbi:hypothetical protein C8R45DRAFT_1114461 [Mycena sanguinolenta]|nr:hypothetical protein C8R45DRAFT_1114461 [Mycena sanguinolenta]